jgi:hypothetical protein
MPAYVHINLRVVDSAKQASLAPRFQAALKEAGWKILHFGPVTQILEGDDVSLPMAGVFEFPTLDQALAQQHRIESHGGRTAHGVSLSDLCLSRHDSTNASRCSRLAGLTR